MDEAVKTYSNDEVNELAQNHFEQMQVNSLHIKYNNHFELMQVKSLHIKYNHHFELMQVNS